MPSTDTPTWWADVQQEREDLQGRGRRPAEDWLGEDIDFVPRRRMGRGAGETAGEARAVDLSGADHPLHGMFVAAPGDATSRTIEIEISDSRGTTVAPQAEDLSHELRHLHVADDPFAVPPPPAGARRTVQITGRPGDAPVRSRAQRHRPRTTSDRVGHRPDRVALWAVLLGAILILLAATSSSSQAATPRAVDHAARTTLSASVASPPAAPLAPGS